MVDHANKPKIVVALSLSGKEEGLVKSAISLAQRTESDLILAHSVLPFQSYAYAGESSLFPFGNFEGSYQEISEKLLLEQLNKLAELVKKQSKDTVGVSVQVLHADASIGINSLADDSKASFIVCGYHTEVQNNEVFGMSTAFLFMAESKIPVLALPVESDLRFGDQGIEKICLTDELGEDQSHYLDQAVDFLAQVKAKKVDHIHVNKMSQRELEHLVETVRNAMIMGKIESDESFNLERYVETTKEQINSALKSSFETVAKEKNTTFDHQAVASFGSPLDEIQKHAKETKPDLIVFGRHHFLHRKTLSLGSIPYHSMTALSLPILVIPIDS